MLHGTSSPSELVGVLRALQRAAPVLAAGDAAGASAPTAPLLTTLLGAAAAPEVGEAAEKLLTQLNTDAAMANDYVALFASREAFPGVFEHKEALAEAERHLQGLLPHLARAAGVARLEFVSIQNQGAYLLELPAARTNVPAGWQKEQVYFEGAERRVTFHGMPATVYLKIRWVRQPEADGTRMVHYKLFPSNLSVKAPEGRDFLACASSLQYLLMNKIKYTLLISGVHPARAAPTAASGTNVEMPIRILKETALGGQTNQPVQKVVSLLAGNNSASLCSVRLGFLHSESLRFDANTQLTLRRYGLLTAAAAAAAAAASAPDPLHDDMAWDTFPRPEGFMTAMRGVSAVLDGLPGSVCNEQFAPGEEDGSGRSSMQRVLASFLPDSTQRLEQRQLLSAHNVRLWGSTRPSRMPPLPDFRTALALSVWADAVQQARAGGAASGLPPWRNTLAAAAGVIQERLARASDERVTSALAEAERRVQAVLQGAGEHAATATTAAAPAEARPLSTIRGAHIDSTLPGLDTYNSSEAPGVAKRRSGVWCGVCRNTKKASATCRLVRDGVRAACVTCCAASAVPGQPCGVKAHQAKADATSHAAAAGAAPLPTVAPPLLYAPSLQPMAMVGSVPLGLLLSQPPSMAPAIGSMLTVPDSQHVNEQTQALDSMAHVNL